MVGGGPRRGLSSNETVPWGRVFYGVVVGAFHGLSNGGCVWKCGDDGVHGIRYVPSASYDMDLPWSPCPVDMVVYVRRLGDGSIE